MGELTSLNLDAAFGASPGSAAGAAAAAAGAAAAGADDMDMVMGKVPAWAGAAWKISFLRTTLEFSSLKLISVRLLLSSSLTKDATSLNCMFSLPSDPGMPGAVP